MLPIVVLKHYLLKLACDLISFFLKICLFEIKYYMEKREVVKGSSGVRKREAQEEERIFYSLVQFPHGHNGKH